jgi:hypothetical protein
MIVQCIRAEYCRGYAQGNSTGGNDARGLFADFDKADVTTAFDARYFYFRQIFCFRVKAHVFLEIMFGNVI